MKTIRYVACAFVDGGTGKGKGREGSWPDVSRAGGRIVIEITHSRPD